ncbi:exodeoxyribonuclease V subunit alpha [Spiroplasma litorale]|uniref:Exodeoxyribonuclease V subunit alpha n=1 Tax=Spiroplasma litorale TaxID=216942 RepID=A0A0K1W1I7_9MOLU|nr:AAA family ATPase [Spiroplasma litorale]AKX34046.1 exodeoxyribonuclease V subunit alpha [Spiroplasma litorale]
MKTFKGKIYKFIYFSETGYGVALFSFLDNPKKIIKIVGDIAHMKKDYIYEIEAEQFEDKIRKEINYKVNLIKNIKDFDDNETVIKYLSSPLFPTIGKKLAENIVNYFEKDIINNILKNKNDLLNIKNMTNVKAEIIYNTVLELKNNFIDIFITKKLKKEFLYKLTKDFNDNKIIEDILNNNFYNYAFENNLGPFEEVDKVALAFNADELGEVRISFLVYNIVKEILYQTKNTYTDIDTVKKKINLNLTYNEVFNKLLYAKKEKLLYFKDKKIYTKESYEDEVFISKKLIEIKNKNNLQNFEEAFIDEKIKLIEDEFSKSKKIDNFKFNKEQINSLKSFVHNNVLIITGGPGTGKTTLINAIVRLYEIIYNKNEDDYSILAPTGRAASRIKEDFDNLKTSTIHRLLKYSGNDFYEINKNNMLRKNMIVIDESSILGNHLFSNLLSGICDIEKLVLIGDINQLPSVDYGNLYEDLINSEFFKTEYLILNNRQSEENDIPILANQIWSNSNNIQFDNFKNITFYHNDNIDEVFDKIKYYYNKYSPLEIKDSINGIQVIAPMYKNMLGLENLNNYLQGFANLNPSIKLKKGSVVYKENDKVIFNENNIKLLLFNGDVGFIKKYVKNDEESKIYLDFYSRNIELPIEYLKNIDLNYACSIHKTQGSEYENVILILDNTNSYTSRFVDKRMLYTAITRAKKNLVIISDKNLLLKCANYLSPSRKTTLIECIKNN